MALNIDPDSLRATGNLIETAGTVLELQLGDDVPACGQDEVSQAVMSNLNAWQRWLVQHVRAGVQQAFSAATGIHDTAAAYETQDHAAAARYSGGCGDTAATPTVAASVPPAPPAPSGPPQLTPIPDISGRNGKQLALALESGAGPGPAIAVAGRLDGLASQAIAANSALTAAQTQLLASGESAASWPLMTRLTRAIAWTEAVAGHASALSAGYTSAASLHTSTKTAVGSSAEWEATETAYRTAVSTPGAEALAQGYRIKLTGMQQQASTAMTGYQSAGETSSTPPGTLPDPGLDPNSIGAAGPVAGPAGDTADKLKDGEQHAPEAPEAEEVSGMQDILSALMGALSPLMESVGQANPLSSLGQLGQQLSQQAGDLAKAAKPASSPIKPAALVNAHRGAGSGHKGGGGGSIKPAASLGGAVHPAALFGTPASSPPATPIKPAAAASGASPSGASGIGMMPMGHGASKDKPSKINSYEQPLPEVEDTGRPGVLPGSAKPEPVVNPEVKNAVKARLAARKKDTSPTTDS
ncbi:Fis family transcriptional regulator [Mycobacterium sp. SM1]|uniref:Fis family transcriptional regulator n=1 Tax=Mycobacterium sp. SM1 TaxID=2816243 RepID=UPI001BD172E3|nr:Fis family transcriptional regulator [Mycobacterium sp. SM1]MBS4730599.1 Fis family transcriptional regulator [Mycobacterium sp. SM1]